MTHRGAGRPRGPDRRGETPLRSVCGHRAPERLAAKRGRPGRAMAAADALQQGREMSADEPTAGRIEDAAHLLPVRVYYEDTDFTGLVYHARYLQFLERGRSDFLRLLGVVHADLLARPDPLVFAVTRMQLAFKAGARIDDTLVVRTRFAAASGARLVLEQTVVRGETVLLDAEVEAVCLTPGGRPRRAPQDLVDAIAPLLPEAVNRNRL